VDVEQRVRPRPAPQLRGEEQASDSIPVAPPLANDSILLRDTASAEPTEEDLAVELAGAIQLQKISTRLIQEKDAGKLNREIVLAAMAIMRSQMGSMQVYHPGRNELYLLVSENFHPDSEKFWEWVSVGEASSCGQAFERGERIVVPDVEQCEFLAGSEDLDHYRKSGMGAVQSTPLISRSGRPIGMISTHWARPHEPSERDLRLFDILARQAADLIERTQSEEHQALLVNELNHRVKNNLAIVQALALQTFKRADVPRKVLHAFEGRLEALASTHDLLTRSHWESADLGELVRKALSACGVTRRASVDGPPLRLGSTTAVTLAMALHELCTNAIKYGALSVETGHVAIDWSIGGDGEPRFLFHWQEQGGPQVAVPRRRGFGSRLMERALANDLKGQTRLEFRADGVRFTIDAPLPSHSDALPS
jgi:two-component sensor histidine kinase